MGAAHVRWELEVSRTIIDNEVAMKLINHWALGRRGVDMNESINNVACRAVVMMLHTIVMLRRRTGRSRIPLIVPEPRVLVRSSDIVYIIVAFLCSRRVTVGCGH